jgi:hypothetical protein
MSNYDTVPTKELLQADDDYSPGCVPVRVEGAVHTEELPTEVVYARVVLGTGSNAVKILNADPRRKKVTFWIAILGDSSALDAVACLGSTSGQAQAFAGAFLQTINAISRYDSTDKGEVWVRPGLLTDTTGTFNGVAISTDDYILSMIIELWSR